MEEWTRWFRKQQSDYGTIEDFARASGIKVRSVSDYRAGRIPRGPAREAIASVLGSAGPLPERPTQRLATLEERVASLEATVAGLDEVRLAAQMREEAVRALRDLMGQADDEGQGRQGREGEPGT